ncbi:MAG: hypothetical protein RL213_1121 [Bacteroidota bacterium]
MNTSSHRPLEVLLLPRWYPGRTDPQLGVFIQKHARAIASLHRVTVFYATGDDLLRPGEIRKDIVRNEGLTEHLYYFGKGASAAGRFRNLFYYLKCWRRFRRELRMFREDGYKPDLVHAYIILRTALLAWLISRRHRIPFLISEQWSGFVSGGYEKTGRLRKSLIRTVFSKADGVSAVSFFLKKNMERIFRRKDIEVISNIIEPEVPEGTMRIDTTVRIAMVADLVDEIKNISGVLRVMSLLVTTRPEVRLTIIGGGRDEEKLLRLSRELGLSNGIVEFLGRRDNPDVYRLLTGSDFLVMNSRFETFSLICAEALRCGKPVVATRCGGPEEIIHERNGILVPVDDEEALLKALEKMCSTHSDYRPESLMADAESRFGMDGAAQGFDHWYRSCLGQPPIAQE